ncbi:hypothetical protein HY492_03060 [Candidatus Woesearchaeota archaeon]|nr:hypothetical protein [Candidatus Woesearchaeota archaeon]
MDEFESYAPTAPYAAIVPKNLDADEEFVMYLTRGEAAELARSLNVTIKAVKKGRVTGLKYDAGWRDSAFDLRFYTTSKLPCDLDDILSENAAGILDLE